MAFEIEATYENGILKPDQLLPLDPKQRVRITIDPLPSMRGLGYCLGPARWKISII